jgi:hypothetical protein
MQLNLLLTVLSMELGFGTSIVLGRIKYGARFGEGGEWGR